MCSGFKFLPFGNMKSFQFFHLWHPSDTLKAISSYLSVRSQTNLTTTSTTSDSGGTAISDDIQPIQMAFNSYESTNPSLASTEPPIIIMHGLLGSKNNWNSMSKFMHNQCRRKIFSVDARNHGDSPHTTEMTYDHLARDILQFFYDLDIKEATLLGHSMGGRAMMCFAFNYPEYVEKLIVLDISPIGNLPSLYYLPRYLDVISKVKVDRNLRFGSARREADRQLAKHINDVGTRQFILTNLVKDEEGGYKWRMNVECLKLNYRNISSFQVNGTCDKPTYFIGGGNSDFIPQEDHEKIRQIFSDVKFDYVSGAGHLVHLEQPKKFIDLVCNFVGPSVRQFRT